MSLFDSSQKGIVADSKQQDICPYSCVIRVGAVDMSNMVSKQGFGKTYVENKKQFQHFWHQLGGLAQHCKDFGIQIHTLAQLWTCCHSKMVVNKSMYFTYQFLEDKTSSISLKFTKMFKTKILKKSMNFEKYYSKFQNQGAGSL